MTSINLNHSRSHGCDSVGAIEPYDGLWTHKETVQACLLTNTSNVNLKAKTATTDWQESNTKFEMGAEEAIAIDNYEPFGGAGARGTCW